MGTPRRPPRFFTPLHWLVTAFLFVEVAVVLGLALSPAVALVSFAMDRLPRAGFFRSLGMGLALSSGYLLFGLALVLVLPLARLVTFSSGTPEGRFPYFSFGAFRWASYNALTLVLRFSFVNWIRLTPILPLYHRLMGARIGRRVHINTAVVADQNLLEIGDDTVIGGDATLVGHVAEGGHLIAAKVRIGRGVTVGLMAVIMPGCTIGDGAVIAAGAVLKKGEQVGPGEIWAGVPARRVGTRRAPD